jgi:hypothetical protein
VFAQFPQHVGVNSALSIGSWMNDAATTREGLQMNRDQFGQSRTMSMLFVGNGLNADPDKFPISLQCLAADVFSRP